MTETLADDGATHVPAAVDEQDDRWCMAVRLLGRIEQRLDRALQRGHGLPLSDYRALCALCRPEAEGTLRMGELAERIGLKESSVTRLAARLEAQGLLRRTHGREDRRGVTAVVTEAGHRQYTEATDVYRAALGAELDAARGNPHLAALALWVLHGPEEEAAFSVRSVPPDA